MFELKVSIDSELSDALSGCLFEAGAEGLEEREDDDGLSIVTYAAERAALEPLVRAVEEFRERAALVLPDAHVGQAVISDAGDAWQETWQAALQPAQVTDRFVLRPTHRAPAPEGESTLWFVPEACFGSGSHPTTRLASQRVQDACLRAPGRTLLDVGSGSGVLCFVALRSGAKRAIGVDIEPVAVENARANARLNELAAGCEFSDTELAKVPGSFELVVANIDAPTLKALATDLAAHLAPGGELFVTGLLDEQEADVRAAFDTVGLRVDARHELGEWVLLALSHR